MLLLLLHPFPQRFYCRVAAQKVEGSFLLECSGVAKPLFHRSLEGVDSSSAIAPLCICGGQVIEQLESIRVDGSGELHPFCGRLVILIREETPTLLVGPDVGTLEDTAGYPTGRRIRGSLGLPFQVRQQRIEGDDGIGGFAAVVAPAPLRLISGRSSMAGQGPSPGLI